MISLKQLIIINEYSSILVSDSFKCLMKILTGLYITSKRQKKRIEEYIVQCYKIKLQRCLSKKFFKIG